MSTRGLHNTRGKIFPSGPTAPGRTVIRAVGTICRFMSLRAWSTDEFGGVSHPGHDPLSHNVRHCG